MDTSKEIAKHLREVYFGGNWTDVNLKETLDGITWQQAVKSINNLNSIATLVVHMHYYIKRVTGVLQGNPLAGSDKESFNLPPIQSQDDWEKMIEKVWEEVETLALLIEKLDESKWTEIFYNEKYGKYYRNFHGIIEHCHYHLGQIVLLKKIIAASGN